MKISTDGIQGFAEMSDADKVTALLGIDAVSYTHLDVYKRQ